MPNLRQAINDFCKECIYDPTAEDKGPWRMQVRACEAKECPLFTVRPRNARRKAANVSTS